MIVCLFSLMRMSVHLAKCMDSMPALFDSLLKKEIKTISVFIFSEDTLIICA
jgi:hypothetical protein